MKKSLEKMYTCQLYVDVTPGKNISGSGDRVPTDLEIKKCSKWLNYELKALNPNLIIPVGKLAISQFVNFEKLNDVVGKKLNIKKNS